MYADSILNLLGDSTDVIGIGLASLLVVLLSLFKDQIFKFFVSLLKFNDKQKQLEAITKNSQVIHDELVGLRTTVQSDRVSVHQFHNGSVFLPQTPVWKMTCTYEICARGVSYEGDEIKDMPISRMWDVIAPILPGSTLSEQPWLTSVSLEEMSSDPSIYETVYIVDVTKLPLSYSRHFFSKGGTSTLVVVPIFNEKKEIVAAMFLDFFHKEDFNTSLDNKVINLYEAIRVSNVLGVLLAPQLP